MPKSTWIVPAVLSALLVLGALGWTAWKRGSELAAAQAALDEGRKAAEQSAAQAAALKADLDSAKAETAELTDKLAEAEKEMASASKSKNTLEEEMRAALQSKDITISQLQGRLTVDILDHVLFDSGEAALKSEGQEILHRLATVLATHTNRAIHVVGHTDNVPIRAAARSRFASNWELSTTRATAAVRFLHEHAGVNPRQLGALGYGEFHPVADNATPEGRAKNRRIAVVILPEELAARSPGSSKQ
ncbi:MAG: OmpA family protein [Verrucomicrobia bacterium]|nr:OmpA family protein [Verrucomicrobiota bacterium]